MLTKMKASNGPSPQLDKDIATVLGRLPGGAEAPPRWTASIDDAMKLFNELLPGRPMEIVPAPGNKGFICSVKLYGSMPATFPYAMHIAKTAAMALMAAMIQTLLAVEIDPWS
ncbi:MAG TPA: hypothetical protein VKX28_07575 [Xanthobacteraceae bacterium]|nr:hypothetical protein [Xanthobacteraceae bacterium]